MSTSTQPLTVRDCQTILNRCGFPAGAADGVVGRRTRAATRRFQLAWAGGPFGRGFLEVDGVIGSNTREALEELSATRKLSPHFSVAELRSGGNGTCYVRRELLAALERVRAELLDGSPLVLRSAYRDQRHNAAVGGATRSQHLQGLAADLAADRRLTVAAVTGLRAFAGLGDKDGTVIHVDLRDLGPWANGATPHRPARWSY